MHFLGAGLGGGLKIGKFALLGLLIEVVVGFVVPNHWVVNLLAGDGVWPVFALTFATIPLHLPQVTAASMIFGSKPLVEDWR